MTTVYVNFLYTSDGQRIIQRSGVAYCQPRINFKFTKQQKNVLNHLVEVYNRECEKGDLPTIEQGYLDRLVEDEYLVKKETITYRIRLDKLDDMKKYLEVANYDANGDA